MADVRNLFHILETVDSTNNYAMGMVRKGIWKHGNACLAYEQTGGKGRRGKSWESKKRDNILLSLVIDTSMLCISSQFLLSMVASLSCYSLFLKYAKKKVKIKWPNDIYWDDRKAAGILVENVIQGKKWQWAIVGIGMNINQDNFDGYESRRISLSQVTGKRYDVIDLSKELYKLIYSNYDILKAGNSKELLTLYNDHLYKKNEKVTFRKGLETFVTTIKEVAMDGGLLVSDTQERRLEFDEIDWIF